MVTVTDLPTSITPGRTRDEHIADHNRLHGQTNTAVYSADYDTLQAAADDALEKGRTLILSGAHEISRALTICCSVVNMGASITSTADPAIYLGDTTNRYRELHISLPDITGGGVVVRGLSDCTVTTRLVSGAAVGLRLAGNDDYGCQTNQFNLGRFEQCGVGVQIKPDSPTYAIANNFYGGHIRRTGDAPAGSKAVQVDGYAADKAGRAKFYGLQIEGAHEYVLDLNEAANCEWFGCDFNATPAYNCRSVNGLSNTIYGGANMRGVTWTTTGQYVSMIGEEHTHLSYSSGHAIMAVQQRNTDGHSAVQVKRTTDDLYDNADFAWNWTANRLEGRTSGDAYPRIVMKLDGTPGLYLGDGTAYPNTPAIVRNAAGKLQTNDIEAASGFGLILTDTSTGARRRVRVTNGTLASDALA